LLFPGNDLLCSDQVHVQVQATYRFHATFMVSLNLPVANLLGLLIFFMKLICLYVNCYVLCFFLANYEYIFAQFDTQNLDLPLFLQFPC
jgi:hypothetical protein